MRFLFSLFFCFMSFVGVAQQMPSEMWHPGMASLTSGEEVYGKIKYDLNSNLIQLDRAGQMLSFSSAKAEFFRIQDQYFRYMRLFYSLPYDFNEDGYSTGVFFEVLYQDTVSLLCREYITPEAVSPYSPVTVNRLEFNYFILDQVKGIIPFSGKRKDLFQLLRPYKDEVKDFIKENRLRTDRRADLIRIIQHYNQLIKGESG